MLLPLCWMGGFDSTWCNALSLLNSQLLLRMVPCTTTWFELPVLTVISPEPVSTSTLTAPDTCSVRSKCPSLRACNIRGRNRKLSRIATGCRFMAALLSLIQAKGCQCAAARGGRILRLLLQYDLIAFLQA